MRRALILVDLAGGLTGWLAAVDADEDDALPLKRSVAQTSTELDTRGEICYDDDDDNEVIDQYHHVRDLSGWWCVTTLLCK